jgi:hypothetical protein
MDTPASKEATDKSISAKSAAETEAKDLVEVERSKPVRSMHGKMGWMPNEYDLGLQEFLQRFEFRDELFKFAGRI